MIPGCWLCRARPQLVGALVVRAVGAGGNAAAPRHRQWCAAKRPHRSQRSCGVRPVPSGAHLLSAAESPLDEFCAGGCSHACNNQHGATLPTSCPSCAVFCLEHTVNRGERGSLLPRRKEAASSSARLGCAGADSTSSARAMLGTAWPSGRRARHSASAHCTRRSALLAHVVSLRLAAPP
jgi:hypothetical protein